MNFSAYIDLAILAVPFLIALYIIIRFVAPKRPKLGLALVGITGILGGILIKRRMNKIFAVEEKIAEDSEPMRKFKNRQKRRNESVIANDEATKLLQEQRDKLAKHSEKNATKIAILDKEIAERQELSTKLLQDADALLTPGNSGDGSRSVNTAGTIETDQEEMPSSEENGSNFPMRKLRGFSLTEVK
ncbi:MAG: hypothetical protein DWQ05_01520 [Calditrichaeota bacterium]|nr:MAG: hypothetical protein DWQ05_01520 [Calditrichota bacterium]